MNFSFKYSLLSALALVSFVSRAQQDPLYGLYINNPLVINPAFTGITNNLDVNVGYRTQWAGFDGSPTTMNANGSISLYRNKIGAGLQIIQDNVGENKNTSAGGLFAYKLNLNRNVISFGMSAGFINYKISPSQLNLQNPDDPLFATVNEIRPTLGAGIVLKTERYTLGFSVPRIFNSTLGNGGQNVLVYQPHYYIFGSYLFFVNENIVLRPSSLIKGTQGSPISLDVNVNVIFNRKHSIGAYTRNLNSVGLLAQLSFLDKFRLAYSFEVPTENSVGSRFTTNEIMLGIRTAVFTSHAVVDNNF